MDSIITLFDQLIMMVFDQLKHDGTDTIDNGVETIIDGV